MFTDAITLIDQTIDHLETLAAVFADETDERIYVESKQYETAAYRVAYSQIGSLLPVLRAARIAQEMATRSAQREHCINCD